MVSPIEIADLWAPGESLVQIPVQREVSIETEIYRQLQQQKYTFLLLLKHLIWGLSL